MEAQVNQVALPLRSHTILGICEAIGEDFGFNPVLLRVPLAAMVIWSPMIAIGSYLGLGIAVLDDAEARALTPLVVHVDDQNRVVKIGNDPAEPVPGSDQRRGDLIDAV